VSGGFGAAAALLALVVLAGCQPREKLQAQALTLDADAPARRQQQTRRFDTADDKKLLQAAVGVMQDLGFQIDESTGSIGLVIGSKDRTAIDPGQVTGQILLLALLAAGGVAAAPVYDQAQRIRLSIIVRPSPDHSGSLVRVTFQRVVRDNMNRIAHVDTLDGQQLYRDFFDRLGQAVFLEAHEI
jgi:hypothetical protein